MSALKRAFEGLWRRYCTDDYDDVLFYLAVMFLILSGLLLLSGCFSTQGRVNDDGTFSASTSLAVSPSVASWLPTAGTMLGIPPWATQALLGLLGVGAAETARRKAKLARAMEETHTAAIEEIATTMDDGNGAKQDVFEIAKRHQNAQGTRVYIRKRLAEK